MKNLLIVANTPSPNTHALAQACLRGTRHTDIENVKVKFLPALEAHAEDVLNADGIIIGTTENFGYMSGLIKDFFERIYYPCLELKQGLPYALYIRAGNDGFGTKVAVSKILTGLSWQEVAPTLLLKGDYQESFAGECEELGLLVAAGLDVGIF